VFEDGVPKAREVDKLSADVETLCYDWRRMRSVIERLTRTPWWTSTLYAACIATRPSKCRRASASTRSTASTSAAAR